jgi:autotransporter translocation and assembly factor TamB
MQHNVNISAGKYINDNIYISVNKKSEGATFDVDFSITPKISIKANTGGEAGLSWKYRY